MSTAVSALVDALGRRLEQARRDARAITDTLRGVHPSPLVRRRPGGRSAPPPAPTAEARAITPRPMRIDEVVRETPDAVSIYLAPLDGAEVTHLPGQFLTFEVEVDGQVLRRAYSLANPARPGARLQVTVKRVAGGRVSNHLNDHAAAGQTLMALGPSGDFVVRPDPAQRRKLVLLAGGSGITPIVSIAETVLATEPESEVVLIYGNRRWEDVIFAERLAALERRYAPRLVVDHVLEEPSDGWTGGTGRLDEEVATQRLEALTIAGDVEAFVCGPDPMRDAVRRALRARGVERIHEERFHSPQDPPSEPTGPREVVLRHRGRTVRARAERGQTLLEAGLAAGVDMPFSCAMGGCGACRVRLREGQVQSDEPNCLSDEERAEGFVLACCSRPLTAVTLEVP